MTEPIQVVIAYDFTHGADEALARAVDVAARAPQHVLHFVSVLDRYFGLPTAAVSQGDYHAAEQVQELLAEHVAAQFSGRETASEVQFYVHARIGKPAEEILALAQEIGADLIFVGPHGEGGVGKRLLGSTTEQIVRRAHCPVMVAREKTYPHVDLIKVVPYEHEHRPWNPPHRYSITPDPALLRPHDWPIS